MGTVVYLDLAKRGGPGTSAVRRRPEGDEEVVANGVYVETPAIELAE